MDKLISTFVVKNLEYSLYEKPDGKQYLKCFIEAAKMTAIIPVSEPTPPEEFKAKSQELFNFILTAFKY